MKKILNSLLIILTFTIITGLIYPLFIFGIGKIFCSHKTEGSLLVDKKTHTVIGSKLIGQAFIQDKYFHSRPSVCNYDGMNSSASNLGPTSQEMVTQIQKRSQAYKKTNSLPDSAELPSDAVCASASGLDPQISIDNAKFQAKRVANARGLRIEDVYKLIKAHTEKPFLGIMGTDRVNVLLLNAALDGIELE